ncbi:hypothetical protein RHO15_09630 [Utexia brackfieldae]|uniref:hypothetical protein n=1 Tax=Utexia brackfieldae TaxID=3074108 RepID=UPI00370CFCF9
MLKLKLTNDEFNGLDESVKALYEAKDGQYMLAVEGIPDVTGLQRKVEELLGEKKAEQSKRVALEEETKRAQEEQARKQGNIEAIEKSWQDKLAQREKELLAEVQGRDNRLHTLLVDNEAQRIATALAGDSAGILLPHIKSRLTVEDGKTRVLDGEGRASALTLEDLSKEFQGNALFAPVIIQSKASGSGGAAGQPHNSGAVVNNNAGSLADRAKQIIEQQG